MNFTTRLELLGTVAARYMHAASQSAHTAHPRVAMAGADVSIANIADGRGDQDRVPPSQRVLKRCADHLSALCDSAATIQSP